MKLKFRLRFPKLCMTWCLCTAPDSAQPILFFITCIFASQDFLWFLQNPRIACTFRPLIWMDLLDVLCPLISVGAAHLFINIPASVFPPQRVLDQQLKKKKKSILLLQQVSSFNFFISFFFLFIYWFIVGFLPWKCQLHEIRGLTCRVCSAQHSAQHSVQNKTGTQWICVYWMGKWTNESACAYSVDGSIYVPISVHICTHLYKRIYPCIFKHHGRNWHSFLSRYASPTMYKPWV